MAKQVCVDALIYWNGSALIERNDATVSQDVDVAEAKPFVASLAAAYSSKTPTWKSWTVSLKGYYDDSDNTVQNAIRDGTTSQIVIYPTRTNITNYWYGNAFCNSATNGITSEDYSTMDADFTGDGLLTWINA